MSKNKLGWLFLGIGVSFGLLFLKMSTEGSQLLISNLDIGTTMPLYFLGVNLAESISTTESLKQYGTYLCISSLVPFLLTIYCYRKFLKHIPTTN